MWKKWEKWEKWLQKKRDILFLFFLLLRTDTGITSYDEQEDPQYSA